MVLNLMASRVYVHLFHAIYKKQKFGCTEENNGIS